MPNPQDPTVLAGSKTPATEVRQAFETPEWYFSKLGYRIRLRSKAIAEMTEGFAFRSYLDVGCGDGSISIPFLNEERELTLQDLSQSMLDRCRAKVPPDLISRTRFLCGDFREAGLKDENYDLIICLGVLSYIDEIDPFIKQLTSLLQPGGYLLIECTDRNHFVSRVMAGYSAMTGAVRGHKACLNLHSHRATTVAATLKTLGYEIEETYRYSTAPPIFRNVCNQDLHYRVNRLLHGDGKNPRLRWLGSECIFQARKRKP